MEIHTYWWGAELYPESDTEWVDMKTLFTNVTDLGGYDRNTGENLPEITDKEGMARRVCIFR